MRTNWLKAWMLPVGLLGLCSMAGAAVVDCTKLTINCKTFQKGGAKFKPILSSASGGGTCTTSTPANLEAVSIKGTLADCVVSNPNVKVISGSAKGTIYTADCSCAGLANPTNPIVTPPPGKTNTLVTSWKFDTTSTDTCMTGQKSTTLVQIPTMAAIHTTPINPGAPFSPALFYGEFSLMGAGTGVSGIFQGTDVGAWSVLVAISTESITFLGSTCNSVKGLKGVTFGVANAQFQ